MEVLQIPPEAKVYKYKSEERIAPGLYLNLNSCFKDSYKLIMPILSVTYNGRFYRLVKLEKWILKFLNIPFIDRKFNHSFDLEGFKAYINKMNDLLYEKEKARFHKWQLDFFDLVINNLKENKPIAHGLVVGMGGGKTLSTLMLGYFGKVLYIGPKQIEGEIEREIEKWSIDVDYVYSTPDSAHKHKDIDFKVAIIDECLSVKNPESRRSGRVKEVLENIPIKICMTGTPISAKHGPDARWILTLDSVAPVQENNWKWLFGINPRWDEKTVPGKKIPAVDGYNVKQITEFISDNVMIADISEIMAQIPEMREEEVWLPTPRYFNGILRGLLTEKTKMKALAQARASSAGFVYNDNDSPVWLTKTLPEKISWIKDFIENNPEEPVIICSYWRAEIQKIAEALKEYNPAVIADKNASDEVNKFVSGNTNIAILSSSITEGMNLQRARIMIGTSWSPNPVKRSQGIGRIYRQGQKKGVVIYNLLCKNTLDYPALRLLREHANASKELINALLEKELEKLLAKKRKS